MPIGATVGAAVVGAGASIYGSSKAAKAQQKASEQAAASQNAGLAQAAQIQAQSAKDNNAFAEHMYNRNEGWLSPTIMGGWAAGDQIMGLLLGTSPNASKPGMAPSGWYPSTPPKPVSTTPGAPGGPPAPSPQQSLDAWYMGAVNAMLPNITQPDNIARINAAATPEAKFNAAMAISPASSDQYALYQSYAAQNPKPTVPPPATPTAPATNQVLAQQPSPSNAVATVARTAYPRLTDFRTEKGFDTDAFLAARDAHNAAIGFDPRGSNGYPAPVAPAPGGSPAPGPAAPTSGTPPVATPPATTPPAAAPNNALSAWDTWKKSTNYQERLNASADMLATKYAAAGAFESGAEKQALSEHAQVFASNELAAYMDQLYRQQALGASAASSLSGVGMNLVSQVSNNNSAAANAAAGAAAGAGTTNGNAILAAGQSSAQQWGNIGSAIGTAAGGVAAAFQPQPNYVASVPVGYGGGTWAPPQGYGGIYDDIYYTS